MVFIMNDLSIFKLITSFKLSGYEEGIEFNNFQLAFE